MLVLSGIHCVLFMKKIRVFLASIEAEHDDFWDYDQQVDLESFSAPTVYDILSRQARDVTKDLGKQKEEVCLHFTKSI